MHDPMTVAFDIRFPWFKLGAWPHRWTWLPASWRADKYWKDGYRETLATIWHVDPERDGSDDSCGWSRPRLSDADKKLVKELVEEEIRRPYYFAQPPIHEEKSYKGMDDETRTDTFQCYRVSPGDCAALVAELFRVFNWRLRKRWTLSPRLLAVAMSLGTAEHDNFQSGFAFWEDEVLNEDRRRDKITRTFYQVLVNYRGALRPWYRHPRWHLWHWRIQVRVSGTFKRWAFSRCCRCGKGFAWGYAPTSYSWNGTGPRWFRSEPDVFHSDCDRPHAPTLVSATSR